MKRASAVSAIRGFKPGGFKPGSFKPGSFKPGSFKPGGFKPGRFKIRRFKTPFHGTQAGRQPGDHASLP